MRILLGLVLLAACQDHGTPTPTETICPTPDPNTLTYDNFGQQFMTDYCISCHDSALPRSARNGAPLYHDFETLLGVFVVSGHIDEESGSGPAASNSFMPPDRCPAEPGGKIAIDCPQPTEEERQQLSAWLACEVDRPHDF
ncbi:MAG: hypothetical protein ABI867_06410 [Kofleriaceae bacterium]